MKTKTLKVLLVAIAVSAISLMVIRKLSASNLLPTMAVAVSYLAIAILFALAAVDYRVGSKTYDLR